MEESVCKKCEYPNMPKCYKNCNLLKLSQIHDIHRQKTETGIDIFNEPVTFAQTNQSNII